MIRLRLSAPEPPAAAPKPAPPERPSTRKIVVRALLLCLTGISLYLLAPSLLEVFSSWRQLNHLNVLWVAVALCCEAASFISLWALQRVGLRTRSWFAVGTSQLSANAAGSVIPGGGAAATAVQYGILIRSGVPAAQVASGLVASWAASSAALCAIPVVGGIAAIGGTAAPRGLREVAYVGAGAFILMALGAAAAFAWDAPLVLVGRAGRGIAARVRMGDRFADLPDRLIRQRDQLRIAFSERPAVALLATAGKWGFDYLALLCVLAALHVRPELPLLLLAYGAAQFLSTIPVTPGGLGFVEAGLVGLLALAGVDAGSAAVATFGYRLISFWLPLPAGLAAYLLARRRYPAKPGVADPSQPLELAGVTHQ